MGMEVGKVGVCANSDSDGLDTEAPPSRPMPPTLRLRRYSQWRVPVARLFR